MRKNGKRSLEGVALQRMRIDIGLIAENVNQVTQIVAQRNIGQIVMIEVEEVEKTVLEKDTGVGQGVEIDIDLIAERGRDQ